MPAAVLDLVRQEWEDSHRRLLDEARGNAKREDALMRQVEAVAEQLRRRVGQWFTLAELADAYSGAEVWSRDAVADRAPFPGWVQTLSIVEGAAFHLYSRGAVDYRP